MTIELFKQCALINFLVWFWVASSATAVRLLIKSQTKVSLAVMWGVLFGPLALVMAWLLGKLPALKDNGRVLIAIFLGTLFLVAAFYVCFVWSPIFVGSSETVINGVIVMVVPLGCMAGLLLSHITRRVAFFEACWTTASTIFFVYFLASWAEDILSFGTSQTYLLTVLLTVGGLLLIFQVLGGAIGYLLFGEGRFALSWRFERFVGFRFLMTKRSSHVISLITVISVVAVMIACSGMIVVMSVMNGFSSDLRNKIIGANAHLMLLRYGEFKEYDDIVQETKKIPGVMLATPFVVNEGMVSSNKNLSGALITGIDIKEEKQLAEINKYVDEKSLEYLLKPETIPLTAVKADGHLFDEPSLKEEKNELPGVIIGKQMASDLGVFIGDAVNLISPIGDIGPTGPMPKAKPFRIAGFFYSGMYEYDAKFVYVKLSDGQDFFNMPGAVTGIEYRVDNIENTRAIAKNIEEEIGGYPYYTRDWMQMNRNMFSALQLEKIAMLIILGTLIFMACLLILVTLIMVVMEKGKEIAILKSMGATDVSIMKIFVTHGLTVGGFGAFLGGALGLLLCLFVEKVGIRLDPDVYYFSNLPVKIEPVEISLVIISAILVSFLATIPPALFAARLKPVEGLRYE